MKKILLTVFQLSVTIGVLYWVYHDPDRRAQMLEAIRNAQYRWVAMGVLAYAVVELAAAFRWYVLLKVQKIRLTLPRLAGLFFIGMFYNQFLPGGTGGDIIKSYYLLKETPDKKAGALLAVVFDRFIGLVALVAITVTLIGLRYDFLAQTTETRNLLWLLLFLLGTSVLTLISTFVISGFNLFHSLPEKFPGRDKLIEISAAYHLYAHHWRATLVAFGASLIAHLATFTTFLCAAYALGAPVPLVNFFAVMPVERTISALPISFAMTVDGKVTTKNLSPVDFTSREDKLHLFRQRALADAVLIGHTSLKRDNVRLGLPTEMQENRVKRGQRRCPLRVIVSNEGRIDHRLKIFQSDVSPILIFIAKT